MSRLVNIAKAFTLTLLREGQVVKLRIEAGIQHMEEDAADHAYTKAHSADLPKGEEQAEVDAVAEQDADNASQAAEADAQAETVAANAKANRKK